MAAITIATNDVAELVNHRIEILQLPVDPDETITLGQYARLDASTAELTPGSALSATEVGHGGLVVSIDASGVAIALRKGVANLGNALSGLSFGDSVYLGTVDGQLVDTLPDASEVVQILMDGTAGSFGIIYGGGTSDAMPFDTAETTMQDALDGLSTIGPGNAIANLPASGTYTITFVGELRDENVSAITIDDNLTGGTATVSVTTSGTHHVEIGTVIPVFGNGVTADKLLRVDVKEARYG